MARAAALATTLACFVVLVGCGDRGGGKARQAKLGPGEGVTFGFNDNGVREGILSPERDAALTRGVGGRVTRLTFDWRYAEPRRGVYDLAVYDRIYRADVAAGVRPLWIVM